MRVFHCDHCSQPVFFENVRCLRCGAALAFLPDLLDMASLEPDAEPGLWRSKIPAAATRRYRLCENYDRANVCNWAVRSTDESPLCRACRLTHVIPDLDAEGGKERWYKLEVAKRRLVYGLLALDLPVADRDVDPERGLEFRFLEPTDDAPVLTGHDDGVITINVVEADDIEREKRRKALHEPYRTLLGHFRHESGHYYWQRLVLRDEPRLAAFRELFGDERADYGQALQRHYDEGPRADWQESFVSAYGSAHPWEDWAETWAHFLHMTDALEMAASCGLALRPRRPDEPALEDAGRPGRFHSFDRMIEAWFPLTYLLNNLNRGLGLPDGYPFVVTPKVVEKLRFVYDVTESAAA